MLNLRKSWRYARRPGRHSDPARGVRRRIERRRRAASQQPAAETTLTLVAYAVPGARLEQDHPGVRRHPGGQGCRGDHVLRRLG